MYSLCATFCLWRMCTVTDGGCHFPYLSGAVTHSSWDGLYATICCSDGTICEGSETALDRAGSLRDAWLSWLPSAITRSSSAGTYAASCCSMETICVPRIILGSHTGWWRACCYVSWFEALLCQALSTLELPSHEEYWEYCRNVSVKGRPGVILGSPCSFQWEYRTWVSHHAFSVWKFWSKTFRCNVLRHATVGCR